MTLPPLSAPPTHQQCNGACAVVGAISAVDAGCAAKLRDDGDYRLAPRAAHVGLDSRERAVECAEQVSELTRGCALVDMGIPADEAHRTDPRTIRTRKIAGGGTGSICEIGAHPLDPWRGKRLRGGCRDIRAALAREREQTHSAFERDREPRVRVPVQIEQAGLRIGTRRQQLLGGPRQHRRVTPDDERGHRPDGYGTATARINPAASPD
jgi:hypothetical protein